MGIFFGAVFGLLAGAVLLSLLVTALHRVYRPQILLDGQYGMVWLVTGPSGAFLGAVTGAAIAAALEHQGTTAAAICRWGGGSAFVAALLFGVLDLRAALERGREGDNRWGDFWTGVPLWVLPLLWGALLLQQGTG